MTITYIKTLILPPLVFPVSFLAWCPNASFFGIFSITIQCLIFQPYFLLSFSSLLIPTYTHSLSPFLEQLCIFLSFIRATPRAFPFPPHSFLNQPVSTDPLTHSRPRSSLSISSVKPFPSLSKRTNPSLFLCSLILCILIFSAWLHWI